MRVVSARGTLGLALGIASGFATHVHAGENGLAVARVVPRPRASHRTSLCYGTRDGASAGRAPHAASVPMRTADRRAYRVSMTAVVQVDRTDDSTAQARRVLAIVNCSPRVEAGVVLVGFSAVKR